MLRIENLSNTVADKPILKGLSLNINAGEIHAIMGPNGAGKSTLAYTLGGRPGYEVTGGTVTFQPNAVRVERSRDTDAQTVLDDARTERDEGAVDLLALEPHERAAAGLFLGFQYPVEIPGVSNLQFLRESLNSQRKARGEEPLSGGDFIKLAILDETDSGLDIDALKTVGAGINAIMRKPDKAVLLITHYQRLLDYVEPDFVHVLAGGRIVKSGGPELALELEREGYAEVIAA